MYSMDGPLGAHSVRASYKRKPLYSARQRLDQPLHPEPGLLRLPVLPRRRPALHAALCLQGMAAREGSQDGPDQGGFSPTENLP